MTRAARRLYLESMPRPRSILWVDDEIESLSSHVLFLQQQGFTVEPVAHGDDAWPCCTPAVWWLWTIDARAGLELFRAIRGTPLLQSW
jgi:DNA-binding response OmpR family regulator